MRVFAEITEPKVIVQIPEHIAAREAAADAARDPPPANPALLLSSRLWHTSPCAAKTARAKNQRASFRPPV